VIAKSIATTAIYLIFIIRALLVGGVVGFLSSTNCGLHVVSPLFDSSCYIIFARKYLLLAYDFRKKLLLSARCDCFVFEWVASEPPPPCYLRV